MTKFLSLSNLQLGAFHIDSRLTLPTTESNAAAAKLIDGHFELIKDVRGSDSTLGYKRLRLECSYRVLCVRDKLLLLSLNLCPDGTIVRLTSDGLTELKVDTVYTIADVSARAQRAIHLNLLSDLVDQDLLTRYLCDKHAKLITYAHAA